MKLVKTVKICHPKMKLEKTYNKIENVEIFQKHPLGSVTVPVSVTMKKISTTKLLRDFIQIVFSTT